MEGQLTNSEAVHEGQKETLQGLDSDHQETPSLAVDTGGARLAG